MALVSFKNLMAAAESGGYAVGYFEAWNLESVLAIADAAVEMRSPVMLGFSGVYLPCAERMRVERLSLYARLGAEVCQALPVPACLIFNESPHMEWVLAASQLHFGLVMFTDENLSFEEQRGRVRDVVEMAHQSGVAVEGEMIAVPGVSGGLSSIPEDLRLTDPALARSFVEWTGVDALAVNVGQAHVHGRQEVSLDLARLMRIRESVRVPLVLHGASSIRRSDLAAAIEAGVRKINVGSMLKRSYFEAVRSGCAQAEENYNPYEVVGSGGKSDVLAAGRMALQKTVEDLMSLFGSVARAGLVA